MTAASLALLVHLTTAGPSDCEPIDRSAGRALSDEPYANGPRCTETETDRHQAGAPLPSNAAEDSAMSMNRRLGFGFLGTASSLIVVSAVILVCSQTSVLPQERKLCRDVWPWVGGTGLVIGGVGFGMIALYPSDNTATAMAHPAGRSWTVMPTFSLALP